MVIEELLPRQDDGERLPPSVTSRPTDRWGYGMSIDFSRIPSLTPRQLASTLHQRAVSYEIPAIMNLVRSKERCRHT